MKTKLSTLCDKLIEAGWLAAVVAIPLFFNIYTARTFEPDKITLMRSISAVMLLAWLIKVFEEGMATPDNQSAGTRFKAWLKLPMALPTLIIVLVYIISTALSLSPMVSLWGSYQRLQGSYTFISYILIFAMMTTVMRTREQVDRFITTVIITSIPVSLYGIIQHNGLDPLPWAGDVTKRVASNMGNAIFVSSYLVMIVPLTISRLVQSMKAIIVEENASWGHTVLAAVYIFIAAIQVLTIIYSVSRGPQIGLLSAMALVGLLLLLTLRQNDPDHARLTAKEVASGVGWIVAGTLAGGIGGGIGFAIGKGISMALAAGGLQLDGVSTLGAAIGGALGFIGIYSYMAASGKGWRWLWISWPVLGVIAGTGLISFILTLNAPNSPLAYLKENLFFNRLAGALNTEGGTGKVRVLIWEGALNLIAPHKALGVEGEYTDGANPIRPLVGYGPESMFNAFAFVYPTDLAHVEQRGSSADRSHNETMDSLVMTGGLGLLAFYFLMGSLFYYAIKWLGWIPDKQAKWGLIMLMGLGGLGGIVVPYILQGNFVMSGLGLPFGLYAAMLLYLCWRGFVAQPDPSQLTAASAQPILLIGLLGAFVGHFLEVHFVFSIAATYTYFWTYLGLMIALSRLKAIETAPEPISETITETEDSSPSPEDRQAKSRRRKPQQSARIPRKSVYASASGPEGWETWLGSLGLAMAIIMIILTFDFVPVQFSFATGRYSLLWMTSITFLIGFAIALADTATKRDIWTTPVNWGRGILLYIVTSLGYAGFYILLHAQQRTWLSGGRFTNALEAANGLVSILQGFYFAMFLLFVVIAIMLAQKYLRGLPTWRVGNWWLYLPLIAATFLAIFFKNINVVKADIYLKEGERYRGGQQWDNAIAMHHESIAVDSDEDFYYLMLALDYQLKAQDTRIATADRQQAWLEGEKIALEARRLNKYNPDNTGNMGRYYFTLAQILDKSYYDKAISFFQKSIQLAPQNVQYYNLLAQVYYLTGNFDASLDWLKQSAALDALYFPTWQQLGDTYAAKANVDEALKAHAEGILLNPASFADANFDSRLNFYISAKRAPDLVAAFQSYIDAHPTTKNFSLWAIGHIYLRSGDLAQAETNIQQAIDSGFKDARATVELADAYLTQEKYQQAETLYKTALQQSGSNAPQIYSSLGYIYARTNRLQDAIEANLKVVEAVPNDYDSQKNLALLYQQAGQIDQALLHAQAALQVAPEASKADLQAFVQQLQAQQPK